MQKVGKTDRQFTGNLRICGREIQNIEGRCAQRSPGREYRHEAHAVEIFIGLADFGGALSPCEKHTFNSTVSGQNKQLVIKAVSGVIGK